MSGTAFESNAYCDFNAVSANAIAGKDLLVCIWDSTGENLRAISGQKSLTINRSAESIEVTSKDTEGGYKSKISGMKEWSVDTDGLYVNGDTSQKSLANAFENGDPVCLKIVNIKTRTAMFGGLAYITDFSIEAPYDDGVTYSLSLEGNGPLVDLSNSVSTEMPIGYGEETTLTALSIGSLTLSPTFSAYTTNYTASTTNATNTITCTAKDANATAVIKNGSTTVTSGSSATWSEGQNVVTIVVTKGTASRTYTIIVTYTSGGTGTT